MNSLPILTDAGPHADLRPDAIVVGARADRLDADGVIAAAPHVMEEIRRAAVGGHQNVGSAVVVDVRVRRSARHNLPIKSQGLSALLKLLVALIVKHQGKLRIGHLRLKAVDVGFNVAVAYEQIRPPIEVVVEKK